jgi:prepilin-type processing-associated H-X9-DG protein
MVEILVTVAIVAALAALLVPQAARLTKTGQRAQCASNLRQMGVALNSYLGDNKMLFPTSWVSLPCNPTLRSPGEYMPLTAHLAPYLGIDAPRLSKPFVAIAQCPGFPKKINSQNAQSAPFYSTYRLVLSKGDLSRRPHPFGGAEGARVVSALSVEEIYGHPASNFPVIFNLDKETHQQPGTDLGDDVPDRPVFGKGRNVLYLDGHVAFEPDLQFLEDLR